MEVALHLENTKQEKFLASQTQIQYCACVKSWNKEKTCTEDKDRINVVLKPSKNNEDDTWILYGNTIAYSKDTNLVFDASTGIKNENPIILWPKNNAINQRFYFHMDGSIRTETVDGRKYFVGIENDFVREDAKLVLRKLTDKSQVQKWHLVTIMNKDKK